MSDSFHTIVIGAGSGGLTVAVGLANLGKPVAVIEALHVGGDCTNVGCVPSKTLLIVGGCGSTGATTRRFTSRTVARAWSCGHGISSRSSSTATPPRATPGSRARGMVPS